MEYSEPVLSKVVMASVAIDLQSQQRVNEQENDYRLCSVPVRVRDKSLHIIIASRNALRLARSDLRQGSHRGKTKSRLVR
jgi:hypothetical protein